jgi:two-component system, OmpR family, phosphate regulon sensor histidine kinase PhoR
MVLALKKNFLFINAIKFNQDNGSVFIDVSSINQDQIEISIKDTGIGINDDDQAKIFEPFTRLAYAERHEIGGTGVGLPLTKLLLQQMHAEIKLESSVGSGTTCYLRFSKAL